MRSDSPPDRIVDRLRTLGKRICAAREAQNLSQEDLGTATRPGRSRIDQVERGADDTNLDDLLLIAHAVDVLPADLIAD
jgi:transcriptional regulator with XRE-family HTH domain